MSSSYEFEDPVADKLQAVTNEEDEVGVVTSLKDEGALKVAVPQTLPEDVADDQLPIVGMKSIFKKVLKCLKKGGGEEEEEEEEEDHDDDDYDYLYDDDDDDYDEEDDDVGIIGVYGMGGVGKTTLLTQIKKKLLQMKNDFDVVIWVVDLQHDKIQQQIGEQIGLFDNKVWEDKDFKDKASDISNILKEKKFVLLMDGLWERVDLTKVGVPLPGPENSSKIVFTTRSLQICSLMGADKLFKVKRLRYREAWKLFKALVGDETLRSHREVWDHETPGSHLDVRHLARAVCRECRGLPLALVSLGQTVRKKSPQEWRVVLDVLRGWTTSYPGSDDQLKKDIRDNLKLSYDNLQNDMFKSCFLYCCLFPRYCEIKKTDLIDYWIGEGFLDERLGAVQSRGHYIIDVFLSVCLLEQSGEDDSSVKMHYWIHDMSLWIASKIETEKGYCFFFPDTCNFEDDFKMKQVIRDNLAKATRISQLNAGDMKRIRVVPPRCPLLQTLFLIRDESGSNVLSDDHFFYYMPSLKVLNLLHDDGNTKLPSGISKLISLQHLDLSGCTKIQGLPKELRALKKLKCLNLEDTHSLCEIPRQLISEFSMLHVLRLWNCGFMLQSKEDSVECNDAQLLVEELLCLKNLGMLSITLNNSHALQRLLSSNRLQSCIQSLCLQELSHPKSIKVPLPNLKNLNTLEISECEYLGELEVDFVGEAQAVRESPPSFYFLDKVIINGCPKLRDLTWLVLAPNLKHLEISDCDEMEEIINVGKLSECPELMGNVIPFSKLKFLTLSYLPKLRSIYWTDLPFPDLKELNITACSMLHKVPLTGLKHLNKLKISNCEYLEELEVDFVGEAQAQDVRESPCSFYFLHEVIIYRCPKLRELTWLILAPNLKHLEISNCAEMEDIINVGKLSECTELMGNVIPFSKLEFLSLKYLPKLRSIYWTDLPFPDLKELSITDCPRLPPRQECLLWGSWTSRKSNINRKMKLYVTRFPLISGSIEWLEVTSSKGMERLIHHLILKEFQVQGGDYGGKACSLEYFLNNFGHIESLWILGLETGIDENVVQLKNNKNIRDLGLGFSGLYSMNKDDALILEAFQPPPMNKDDALILEAFQPPPNLQELTIEDYRGTTMSTLRRMTSLTNLRSINLSSCSKCLHMPPLGKLPSLETLVIVGMYSVREVGNEFLGVESGEASSSSSPIIYFPKLKTLHLSRMYEWEVWDFGNEDDTCTIMPSLCSLKLYECYTLKGLPKQLLQMAPLQHLEIEYCDILEVVYEEGKGEKWQDISHIPNIQIR